MAHINPSPVPSGTYVAQAPAPTGVAAVDAVTVQNAITTGQRLQSGNYVLGTTSIVVPTQLALAGAGKRQTTLTYTGTGIAVQANATGGAVMRQNQQLVGFTVDITAAGSGAVGIAFDNAQRDSIADVYVNATGNGNATTCIQFIGSGAKNTYFNQFVGVDTTSSTGGTNLAFGEGCNGHEFFGGVHDGAGTFVTCSPTVTVTDSCRFHGISVQTAGATLASIGVGGVGATDWDFYGCRFEPGASTLTLGASSARINFWGGTWSNTVTLADTGADNRVDVPSAAYWGASPKFGIVRPPWNVQNPGFQVIGTQTLFYRVIEGGRISKIRLHIGTQSGNIAVQVFRNSGSGLAAVPGALVASSGSVACPAAGAQDVALGSTVVVFPGDWIGIGAGNNVVTVAGINTGFGDSTLFGGQSGRANAFPAAANPAFIASNSPLLSFAGVP